MSSISGRLERQRRDLARGAADHQRQVRGQLPVAVFPDDGGLRQRSGEADERLAERGECGDHPSQGQSGLQLFILDGNGTRVFHRDGEPGLGDDEWAYYGNGYLLALTKAKPAHQVCPDVSGRALGVKCANRRMGTGSHLQRLRFSFGKQR